MPRVSVIYITFRGIYITSNFPAYYLLYIKEQYNNNEVIPILLNLRIMLEVHVTYHLIVRCNNDFTKPFSI